MIEELQDARVLNRFWSKVDKHAGHGHWVWTASTSVKGYGDFWVRDGFHTLSHRLSWMMANGSIPEGLQILHLCRHRACVNPAHLYAGTPKQNMLDKVRDDTVVQGEECHNAKLTEAAVRRIRSVGKRDEEWARVYGVSPYTVRDVRQRLTWRHVEC